MSEREMPHKINANTESHPNYVPENQYLISEIRHRRSIEVTFWRFYMMFVFYTLILGSYV